MNSKKFKVFKIFPSFLAALIIVFLSISLFSGCGSADATSKKEKSKKSKAKREALAEEKAETDAANSENKTVDSNSSHDEKTLKQTNEQNKNSNEKKDEKTPVKSSEKDKKASAELIWSDLIKGNKRFMAGKHTTVNYSSMRQQLVKEQHPQAIVLGCADSRVPPEFVFDKNLGELFVVREAGSIADEITLGSIEYAIEHLHSKILIVLGHESCGAVAAAVSGEKMPTGNLREIVDSISPAFKDSKTCLIGGESNLSCVELNVRQSSKDVLMKSPIIKKAVEEGELTIIPAVYRMATGEVVRLD